MSEIIFKKEAYKIVGACMEVHKTLGKGHKEIDYGDTLEHELSLQKIQYSREKKFQIYYKGKLLPHLYAADFVIYDKIILEIKAIEELTSIHIKQTLNYLAASKLKLGLLVNFGESSLKYKRVVL